MLTVECHKFLNRLFLQTYHLWAFGYYARTRFSVPCRQNILIYVNTDYQKHVLAMVIEPKHWQQLELKTLITEQAVGELKQRRTATLLGKGNRTLMLQCPLDEKKKKKETGKQKFQAKPKLRVQESTWKVFRFR